MKLKTISLSILMALLTIFSVMAYSTVTKTAPINNYQPQTTLTVNVSGGINASGFSALSTAGAQINVTILNKSSLNGDWGLYNPSGYIVNASNGSIDFFWNVTITLTEGIHWIALNFTNSSGLANATDGTLSNITAIEIDLDYNIITIGQDVINLSTDTGNINISGILSADGGIVSGGTFTLNSNLIVSSTPMNISTTGDINTSGIVKSNLLRLENSSASNTCDGSRAGDLVFNGTAIGDEKPRLVFCNGVNWYNINMTLTA